MKQLGKSKGWNVAAFFCNAGYTAHEVSQSETLVRVMVQPPSRSVRRDLEDLGYCKSRRIRHCNPSQVYRL